MNLEELTVSKTLQLVRNKEISPKDIIKKIVKNIENDNKKDDKLNAVRYYNQEDALKQLTNTSPELPLYGLPIILKNNMHYKGFPLTCSSNILKNYISPYTATFVNNLVKNGAIILGISNMDEFAMGSSNETSAHGVVRNPLNRQYVPGGSSGGAAAAVQGNQSILSLGSETGGSIRQPASFCGLTGLKTTYGRISRYGLVAYGSSFDQVGPITKTVEDSAIVLKYLSGYDKYDSTSSKKEIDDYPSFLNQSIKGKRIAIVQDSFNDFVDDEIKKSMKEVTQFYKDQQCQVDIIDMPLFYDSLKCYYILTVAELSSNLSRFDSIRYGKRFSNNDIEDIYLETRSKLFGYETKKRSILGNLFLQEKNYKKYFLKAQQARKYITKITLDQFQIYDAFIAPTSPNKVFKLNTKINTENPIDMYLNDLFSVHANITGIPSISIPCEKDTNNLPISFQISGRLFDEKTIFNLAHIYEINHNIKFNKGNYQ